MLFIAAIARVCCEAVRLAILATAWCLVLYFCAPTRAMCVCVCVCERVTVCRQVPPLVFGCIQAELHLTLPSANTRLTVALGPT